MTESTMLMHAQCWEILAIFGSLQNPDFIHTNFGWAQKVDFGAIFGEFSNFGAKKYVGGLFMSLKVGILPTVYGYKRFFQLL